MPKIQQRVGKRNLKFMAISLKDAKNGDIFVAKNGLILYMYNPGNSLAHAPYEFCLKSKETGYRYFYSNTGEYFEGKDPNMNLERSEEGTVTYINVEDNIEEKDNDVDVSGGWETILKIVGWIVFIGGFIACFVLVGIGAEETCWIPIVPAILIPAPIMVFANMATSLKENNALNRQILEELKKLNKNNS